MRIDPALRRELDATGLPWRLTNGGKHSKIYLSDQLVGVTNHGGQLKGVARRQNILSTIRRAAAALKGETR